VEDGEEGSETEWRGRWSSKKEARDRRAVKEETRRRRARSITETRYLQMLICKMEEGVSMLAESAQ
jgi:hypothetical protein